MKRAFVLLLIVAALASVRPASAQSDIGFKAIGGSIAFVNVENLDGTVGLGFNADIGHVAPQITLHPVIEYWSKSEEAFGAKASARDVSLGCRGEYEFAVTNPKIHPFAGAGLGLHFVNSKATVSMPGYPDMTAEASDTKLGLDLGGGVSTPIGPKNDFRAEMWYGIVSDVGQFAMRVGISHRLGM